MFGSVDTTVWLSGISLTASLPLVFDEMDWFLDAFIVFGLCLDFLAADWALGASAAVGFAVLSVSDDMSGKLQATRC